MKLDLDRCTCETPDGRTFTDVFCPVHWPPEIGPPPFGLAVWQAHQRTGVAGPLTANPAALAIVEEWEASGLSVATACSIITDVGRAFAKRHRGDRRARIRSLGYYRAPMAPFVALAPNARHSEAQRAKWERWKAENPRAYQKWLAEVMANEERREAEEERERSERAAARAGELERRRAAEELRAAADRRQAERRSLDASADLTTARRRARAALVAAPGSPFAKALADVERRARRSP